MKEKESLLLLATAVLALGSRAAAWQGCPVNVSCSPSGTLYSTIPETDSYGPATAPFPSVYLAVDQFDPMFYAALHAVPVSDIELKGVEFEVTLVVHEMEIRYENLSTTSSCQVTWMYDVLTSLLANPTVGTPDALVTASAGFSNVSLPAGDGSYPPPWDYEWLLSSNGGPITQVDCHGETTPAGLVAWTGSGALDFEVYSAANLSDSTNCGALIRQFSNSVSVSIAVTYFYCVPVSPSPGSIYCVGDPGVGTPCPCSNDNDGSVPGSGCANGAFTSGAQLTGSGSASVTGDTLVLTTTGLHPNNTGLYFQANNAVNGGDGNPFGDGLRCAGGGLIRIQIRTSDGSGVSSTNTAIASTGGVLAGETKRYQCWYRDTSGGQPCGVGVNDFNLSNGYEITWLP